MEEPVVGVLWGCMGLSVVLVSGESVVCDCDFDWPVSSTSGGSVLRDLVVRGKGAGSGLCSLTRPAPPTPPNRAGETAEKGLDFFALNWGCSRGCSGGCSVAATSVSERKTVRGLGGVGEGVGAGVSGSCGASNSSSDSSSSSLDESSSVSDWKGWAEARAGLGGAGGRSSSGQVSQQYWPRSVW